MPSAELATPCQKTPGNIVSDQSWAGAEKLTGKSPHRIARAGREAFIQF